MIRNATVEDLPAVIELARMAIEESRFRDFGFIPEKVHAVFSNLLAGAGAIFVAERDGEIIGAIACGKGEDFFSNVPLTFDYGTNVKPEYRGGMAGPMLASAYRQWADSLAPLVNINLGLTGGIVDEKRLAKMWERRAGLKVIGTLLSNLG